MIELRYPAISPRTRQGAQGAEVFDPVRKRWVNLSPEEWVRQQFVLLLTETHHYPMALMATERSIELGPLQKRVDLLVYDRSQQPWMLIECKAETVTLNNSVLEQLLRYNMSVPCRYLLITNGIVCWGWERDAQALHPIEKLPIYPV